MNCDTDRWNQPTVDPATLMTSKRGVFAGGDVGGVASTSVEATNDGKHAAQQMHKYLQVCGGGAYAGVGGVA